MWMNYAIGSSVQRKANLIRTNFHPVLIVCESTHFGQTTRQRSGKEACRAALKYLHLLDPAGVWRTANLLLIGWVVNQLPKPSWSCYLVSVRESASYQAVPALPTTLSARIYAGCKTVQTDERRIQPMMLSQTMTRKMKTNNGSSELTKKSPRSDVYEKQSLRREMQVIHLKKKHIDR